MTAVQQLIEYMNKNRLWPKNEVSLIELDQFICDVKRRECEAMTEYAALVTKGKDTRIANLEAKLAQAIEFQKRAFSYGANGCSWEEFFDAQEKEAQESEKGGL